MKITADPGAYVLPGVIESLVKRHAGDAAFYWAQHDTSAHSPNIDLGELLQFNRMLLAHLDGLRVAGERGWEIAFEELANWRGASQAFVCVYLALGEQNGERLRLAWEQVQLDPARALRGVISALAWVEPDLALPWVTRWLEAAHNPALQVTAARAAALGSVKLLTAAEPAFATLCASEQPEVRAAACRLGVRLPGAPVSERLRALLQDPEVVVRAEAAIALGAKFPAESAPVLWQAFADLFAHFAELEGWERFQAERRLERWVRYLGMLLPPGHIAVARLLPQLPARLGLWLALHHADPLHLPWVAEQMEGDDARFAGWVWSALSGVPLESADLALAPEPFDPDASEDSLREVGRDRDAGLPDPDPEAVRAWMAAHDAARAAAEPTLLGRPLASIRRELLYDAPQILRWIAAWRMVRPFVNTRAPALWQYRVLAQLDSQGKSS